MFVSQIIDEATEILATTDRKKVYRKLTQAIQTLMQAGHWYHTSAEVDVCTGWDGQTITLPRNIEVPLAVNIDGSPTYFRNRLFQYHVNKGGMYAPVDWAWDDRGMVSTQMDIRQPSQLVAVAEHASDAGLKIRVVGTNDTNRPLRTQTDRGTGIDGHYVTVHAMTDFPFGTIQPDGVTIDAREVYVDPFRDLVSSTAHQLQSGPSGVFTVTSGDVPVPLVSGQEYFVGVVDDTTVRFYGSELDALNAINPISFSDITGCEVNGLQWDDQRYANLNTVVSCDTVPAITIDSPNEVTFFQINSGTPLPSPLQLNTTYFAQQVASVSGSSATLLAIYETLSDAQNSVNQISFSGTYATFRVAIRKPITAQTKITFTTAPGFSSGDTVQAYTNGGTLPQPLIAGQNYYAALVQHDPLSITLHLTYDDAINGVDSINLITSGSGQNSIAKLIPASAVPGTSNNILAANFTLPTATGSGATAEAIVTGPVTVVTLTAAGSGYLSATATISDIGGYNYTSAGPTVSIVGGTFTTQATASAVMLQDTATGLWYVSGVTLGNAGTGYTQANPPKVVFSGNLNTGGFHAVATAVISSTGTISSVTLNSVGNGASITVSTATADPNRQVNGITINSPGSGYQFPPRISITAPNDILVNQFKMTITGSGVSGTAISALNLTYTNGTTPNTVNLFNGTTLTLSGSPTTSSTAAAIAAAVTLPGYSATASGAVITFTLPASFSATAASMSQTGTSVTFTNYIPSRAYAKTDITTSFISGFRVLTSGSGYQTIPAVSISTGGNGSGASATAVVDFRGIGSISVVNGGSGYPSVLAVNIVDSNGGSGFGATATATVLSGVITSINVTNPGSGYISPQISFTGTGTNWPTATATFTFATTGVVTGINVVTQGTGYTTPPGVSIVPSTGVFVQFSSTGTLPAPLQQGGTYRAEAPSGNGSFTIKNNDFSPLEITSTGSGSMYLVLSRTFGIGFTSKWIGDFSGISSGSQVALESDYQLPVTIPSSSNNSLVYVGKISSKEAYFYPTIALGGGIASVFVSNGGSGYSGTVTATVADSAGGIGSGATLSVVVTSGAVTAINVTAAGLNYTNPIVTIAGNRTAPAVATASLTQPISVSSIGVGQSYYTVIVTARPYVYQNAINVDSSVYLSVGQTVAFTTSGLFPAPLDSNPYVISAIIGNSVNISRSGVNVAFSGIGNGQLVLHVSRSFTPLASTNLILSNSLIETGQFVTVRPNVDDSLPYPLVASTVENPVGYYARRTGPYSFELYDTEIHATTLTSIVGRKVYQTTGDYLLSTFFADILTQPTLVKSILHIEKPVSVGYISLYAFDYGRSNDMALIGQYHPEETNPKYRRIRLGKQCAWARIMYRVRPPEITSVYDYIPLENTRAILAAVHAVDLEDKDFIEQAQKYWQTAVSYLKSESDSMDGHAMVAPQINNITYGDGTDWVMF
jgi:hypothetical protein